MVKVCVVGAAGGIGQPLSLLLKLNTKITALSLYDVVPLVAGVAADVSHINTPAQVCPIFPSWSGRTASEHSVIVNTSFVIQCRLIK